MPKANVADPDDFCPDPYPDPTPETIMIRI
jgi:hypothetical protein